MKTTETSMGILDQHLLQDSLVTKAAAAAAKAHEHTPSDTTSETLETALSLTSSTPSSSTKAASFSPPLSTKASISKIDLTTDEESLLRDVWTGIGGFDPLRMSSLDVSMPYVPLLEARGGTDKDPVTGHRRDSMPMAEGIADTTAAKSAIFQYLEDSSNEDDCNNVTARATNEALRRHLLAHATGVVVRVNPGTLSAATQVQLDNMLVELGMAGIRILTSPTVQKALGAKDALFKIRNLSCGMHDTSVYYDAVTFCQGFCRSMAAGPRVVKQNRGSQGEGIWICKLADESQYGIAPFLSLDTPLVLVEANDNHTEHHTVGEFLEFCIHGRTDAAGEWASTGTGRYLEGGVDAGAMLVDQRFLPRIVEGEVRCLMIGDQLVSLVHKVPQAGSLSATLQSGAHYTNYAPDDPKFAKLVQSFRDDLPHIMQCFGLAKDPLPLLWTADFIFGDDDDTFYVGEFNCSCVGITKQLELASLVAETVVKSVA